MRATGTGGSVAFSCNNFLICQPSAGFAATSATPVFTVGTINGTSAVGIHGNLILDGTVSANSLSVTSLSSLSANIGTVTAGLMENSGGTNYINLNATGSQTFLQIGSNVSIYANGSGAFSRAVLSAPNVVASGSCGDSATYSTRMGAPGESAYGTGVHSTFYVHTGHNVGSGAWNTVTNMFKATFACAAIGGYGSWNNNYDVWMADASIIITPGYNAGVNTAPTWLPSDGPIFLANSTAFQTSGVTVSEGDVIIRFSVVGGAHNDTGWVGGQPWIAAFNWSLIQG